MLLTFVFSFDSEIGARVGQYGVFTSFEKHVPSLISANRDEWEKLVEMFMKRLEKRKLEDGFISDMVRIFDLFLGTEYLKCHSHISIHSADVVEY